MKTAVCTVLAFAAAVAAVSAQRLRTAAAQQQLHLHPAVSAGGSRLRFSRATAWFDLSEDMSQDKSHPVDPATVRGRYDLVKGLGGGSSAATVVIKEVAGGRHEYALKAFRRGGGAEEWSMTYTLGKLAFANLSPSFFVPVAHWYMNANPGWTYDEDKCPENPQNLKNTCGVLTDGVTFQMLLYPLLSRPIDVEGDYTALQKKKAGFMLMHGFTMGFLRYSFSTIGDSYKPGTEAPNLMVGPTFTQTTLCFGVAYHKSYVVWCFTDAPRPPVFIDLSDANARPHVRNTRLHDKDWSFPVHDDTVQLLDRYGLAATKVLHTGANMKLSKLLDNADFNAFKLAPNVALPDPHFFYGHAIKYKVASHKWATKTKVKKRWQARFLVLFSDRSLRYYTGPDPGARNGPGYRWGNKQAKGAVYLYSQASPAVANCDSGTAAPPSDKITTGHCVTVTDADGRQFYFMVDTATKAADLAGACNDIITNGP